MVITGESFQKSLKSNRVTVSPEDKLVTAHLELMANNAITDSRVYPCRYFFGSKNKQPDNNKTTWKNITSIYILAFLLNIKPIR